MFHFHEIHYSRNKSRYILPLYLSKENKQAKMNKKQKIFIEKKKKTAHKAVLKCSQS